MMLTVDQITDLICPRTEGWPAAKACCEAFQESSQGWFDPRLVKRDHLARIYGNRMAGDPEVVFGGDRLATDIASCENAHLNMVYIEHESKVYCAFLDEALRSLVACFVGNDRRLVDASGWS